MGKFEILVTKGDADSCANPLASCFVEYLGFDPMYPHLKVICDRLQNLRTNEDSAASPQNGLGPYRYPRDTHAAITRTAQHTRLHRGAKGRKP